MDVPQGIKTDHMSKKAKQICTMWRLESVGRVIPRAILESQFTKLFDALRIAL